MLDRKNDEKSACTAAVLAIFPDICPDYLQEKSGKLDYNHGAIVGSILDEIDNGQPYPKRPALKRKRRQSSSAGEQPTAGDEADPPLGEDGRVLPDALEKDAVRRFGSESRRGEHKPPEYLEISRLLLRQAFPLVPVKDLGVTLNVHGGCLLPAMLHLDQEIHQQETHIKLKKTRTKPNGNFTPENLDKTIRETRLAPRKEALEEYRIARGVCRARQEQRDRQQRHEREEQENLERARLEGTLKECECCFADCAMNRMVHCDGVLLHWFCKDCVRRMAETQVGLSKYELACMSTDGCQAGFAHDQQQLFLGRKTRVALERIEQEHILRMAGIEDLETCPFCPFAAEYAPVEVDREFRCQNPACQEVSCRLCRKPTHIPKTCAEADRENGPSARLTVEEAMSAALIRNCNKCHTPFIKELGCNKMTCSRPGCHNVQCYVCHQSCTYSHFDDSSRGGKKGNCPLFESAEQRHEDEVKEAQDAAVKELTAKNPGIDVGLLKINLSARVLDDEKRRRDADALRYRR